MRPGAAKAGQFIQLCCQSGLPIVFLQNTTGYLVGVEAETSGIVKHGSKMIQAVTNADVPKLTLQIGGSFGAGHYGMCGRAFGPRFLFSWPNARIAVMGGEQAAKVMTIVAEESAQRAGPAVRRRKDEGAGGEDHRRLRQAIHRSVRHRSALGRRPDRSARQPRGARVLPGDLPRGRGAQICVRTVSASRGFDDGAIRHSLRRDDRPPPDDHARRPAPPERALPRDGRRDRPRARATASGLVLA